MNAEINPYDAIAYLGFAFFETHPNQLASMAAYYGMDPAPPSRCRVLELGCGVGGNLVPMAFHLPQSEFVGIDLSQSAIEQGMAAVKALELRNLVLRQANIMDVDASYGRFDYIIAHGVYSWVPAEVREKVLAICRDNLMPRGVAYISYNSSPASHLRNVARDLMLYHVREITDPKERVSQARAVLKIFSEATQQNSVYGVVMRDQQARVSKMRDDSLFHDDLLESSMAFPLYRFVEDAERHGLQYLCDSSMWRRSLARLPEGLQAMLASFPDKGFMARDQYHDFIDGHGFRRTLLCQGEVQLRRDIKPGDLKRFHLSTTLQPTDPKTDPAGAAPVEFKTSSGETVSTAHPLTKAALLHLNDRWPAAVPFADLATNAHKAVASWGLGPDAVSDAESEVMTEGLFSLVNSGHVDFHLFPFPLVTELSERPEISFFVRKQSELGGMLTTLRHDGVSLEDPLMRRFVRLVDGTRTLDELVDELQKIAVEIGVIPEGKAVTRDIVEHNLNMLARLGLMVR